MEVTITKASFLEALNLCSASARMAGPVVAGYQSCGIFFPDRFVVYSGTDGFIFPTEFGFQAGVSFANLLNVVSRVPTETLVLSYEDGENEVKVFSQGTTAGLRVVAELPLDFIAEQTVVETNTFINLPDDFSDAVKFCSYSMSKDRLHPYLYGVLVEGNAVVSSDNLRVTRYRMESEVPVPFYLPATVVVKLSGLKITSYAKYGGYVCFRMENGGYFFFREKIVQYPQVAQLFESEQYDSFQRVTFPKGFEKNLEDVASFQQEIFDVDKIVTVTVDLGQNKVICTGENELGWFKKELPLSSLKRRSTEERVFSFLVHPDFLAKALHLLTSSLIGTDRLYLLGPKAEHIVLLRT